MDGFHRVLELALERMLGDIREDLEQFGVSFDRWYSERGARRERRNRSRVGTPQIPGKAVREGWRNLVPRDGIWGDEKESGGRSRERREDLLCIRHRIPPRKAGERGFERLIDVLGADHHGYVAACAPAWKPWVSRGDSLEVNLIQFVSLFRGGEKIPMGKARGAVRDVARIAHEVGNDACRFFYLISSHDQPLDFDLELAKSRTRENPVYYIHTPTRAFQCDEGGGCTRL